jgi:hypothetical protein
MRRATISACLISALIAAGCGGKTKTVTTTAPSETVTVTATTAATTPTTTTPSGAGGFRTPKPGEGRLTIGATVARGEIRKTSNVPSDLSQYAYIELQPNDGSEPLRVAAAGDLSLPAGVAKALVDPACASRLRGTFTVMPAARSGAPYDWELLTAQLARTSCGP